MRAMHTEVRTHLDGRKLAFKKGSMHDGMVP